MIYIKLFTEFFKIGLFSFGGGFATIPFLYHLIVSYNWYSVEELKQIISIASITPGPIGINMATYAGFKVSGVSGALLATTAEILPSFLLILIIIKILKQFKNNFYIKTILKTLRPICIALLIAVATNLLKPSIHDYKAMLLLSFLIIVSFKKRKNTLFYLFIPAIVGLCFTLF